LKKLKVIKLEEPQTYELLNKLVTASGNKQFDWSKLPSGSNAESLRSLERAGLIFTRDYNEYVLLYGRIREIMNRVDKL